MAGLAPPTDVADLASNPLDRVSTETALPGWPPAPRLQPRCPHGGGTEAARPDSYGSARVPLAGFRAFHHVAPCHVGPTRLLRRPCQPDVARWPCLGETNRADAGARPHVNREERAPETTPPYNSRGAKKPKLSNTAKKLKVIFDVRAINTANINRTDNLKRSGTEAMRAALPVCFRRKLGKPRKRVG